MGRAKAQKYRSFYKEWLIELSEIWKTALGDAIGYSLNKNGPIPYTSPLNQKLYFTKQVKEMDRFLSDYVKLCTKHGFKQRHFLGSESHQDYVDLDEGIYEWGPTIRNFPHQFIVDCRNFFRHLQSLANHSRLQIPKNETRQRVRVPISIAFEILRALEYAKGNKIELDKLYDLLAPGGEIEQLQKSAETKVKKEIIQHYIEEQTLIFHKHKISANTPYQKGKALKWLHFLQKEKYRVRNFKITWLKPIHRGEGPNNTIWANHLREHMIRVILSKNKSHITKSLKGQKASMNKLLAEIHLSIRKFKSDS